MKNKTLVVYSLILIVTLIIIVGDKMLPSSGDKIGYTIWSYYIILPILILIGGFILGTIKSYKKYFFVLYAGLMYLIASLIVSQATDVSIVLFGMIPSALGICVSSLVARIAMNKCKK